MFAELAIFVTPNEAGNLPVFRVFDADGNDLGLYEAYDEDDAVSLASA